MCTHIIYAYAGLDQDGNLISPDPKVNWLEDKENTLQEFNKLMRLKNVKIKTFIAVGGPEVSSATFSRVAANPEKRQVFVRNAVKFVSIFKFNGISVDWQYPNQNGSIPSDKKNFVLLLKELKEEFDKLGLSLMATFAAKSFLAKQSYDISEIVKYLDTINLMTFDYHDHAGEKKTGINAPINFIVSHYLHIVFKIN